MTPHNIADLIRPNERVVVVVGAYGSGKTEIAVNLALGLARAGRRVQIGDLDLVNPYFRCREARELMESNGIRVVVPPGAQAFADLPIVMREIPAMLHPPEETVTILDVGGDDVGARSLAAFRPLLRDGDYELWQVLNAKRPFTEEPAACVQAIRSIETASRWAVSGLLSNAHLIDETTPDVVVEGWRVARDVARQTGLELRGVTVMGSLAADPALAELDAPVFELERHMLPPWGPGEEDEKPLPAARPVPLGRPPPERSEAAGGSDGQD